MNIVLIVSDTFRQDHLGCYGNRQIRTPNLDRLAEKSVVFEHCYAASFPTVPARADLLTGKYSFTYLGWVPLPRDEITLPQLLTQAGYTTMGIVDTPFYMRNGYGYDRGFADFMLIRGQREGPERDYVTQAWRYEEDYFAPATLGAAEKWLEKHYKEKFFLYIDIWDPHEPWDPPTHYVEPYLDEYDGTPSPLPCYWYWQEAGLTETALKRAHAHYCGEITMVDHWVGRLVNRIESLGLMDNTAIIFVSDHGYYFGEHGRFGKGMIRNPHGFRIDTNKQGDHIYRNPATGEITIGGGQWHRSPLYTEVTRVPLLIYLPQVEAKRTDALVNLPDLMPTILDLAGAEIPDVVQANSLLPILKEEQKQIHELVITSWPLYNPGQPIRVVDDWERILVEPMPSTITDGEWSLLYAAEGEAVELYHIVTDPTQTTNVFEDHQDVATALHANFVDFLKYVGTDEVFLNPRRRLQ